MSYTIIIFKGIDAMSEKKTGDELLTEREEEINTFLEELGKTEDPRSKRGVMSRLI